MLSFIIVSIAPTTAIVLLKTGSPDSVNKITYLNYNMESSISLIYVVYNHPTNSSTLPHLIGSINVFSANYSNNIEMSLKDGLLSFQGNSYGLSPTGMKQMIFADSQSFPYDSINNNFTSSSNEWKMVGMPYDKIFGYINVEALSYFDPIPDYFMPSYNGTILSSGTVNANILSGNLNGGKVLFKSCSNTMLVGNKTGFEADYHNFTPVNRDMFGTYSMMQSVIQHTNSSYSFHLFGATTYTLTSTNVVFPVNISYYLEISILTWSIILVATGAYIYGRSRNWSFIQSMAIPFMSIVIMSLFILPNSYLLYLP